MAKTASSSKFMSKIGVWSYVAGLVIAAIVALISLFTGSGAGLEGWVVGLLVILGLIVGLLNISDEEVNTFLLAAIAFVVASAGMAQIFSTLGGWEWLQVFMTAIAVFTAPGALVVAFKALYNVAKDD
jgi:hypothetical protein